VTARAVELGLAPELARWLVPVARLADAGGRRTTGIAALDRLLGGGWPRGALSEIAGRRAGAHSCGRTAIVQAGLVAAHAAGEATALVDVGGTLDARAPAAAAVPLWIRCVPGQALKAVDLVVSAGGFGLVALDLCDVKLRVPDAAWIRLRHTARANGTTLLVATAGRRLGAFAAAAVELETTAHVFDRDGPALFIGLEARAHRVRFASANVVDIGDRAANTVNASPCASLAFTSRS
jgi:hypothetical protein